MEVKSTKTIQVTSRTLECVKRPKDRNLPRRNVSISEDERKEVTLNDKVILKVYDEGDNLVVETIYTGVEFHNALIPCQTRDANHNTFTAYYLLGY